MGRGKRRQAQVIRTREAAALTLTLGAGIRDARKAKRWRQSDLGGEVGLSQSMISRVELGKAGTLPLDSWVALGIAVDRLLRVELSRPLEPRQTLADAGHLAAQEFLLSLGRSHGWHGIFELSSRPSDPARSVDVAFRDDAARRLLILEIWNRMGDLGAAARSSERKRADAQALAVAIGGDRGPYLVHLAWLLLPTAANRALIRAYPTIFRSRFPGSSYRWAIALMDGTPPPADPAIAWIDPQSRRIAAVRLTAR